MPNWTAEELLAYVERRSGSSRSRGSVAKLESSPSDGDLGKVQVQKPDPRSFLVIVTSFRRRLLDEDNLCCKYHVDCCRYSGLLPGDNPSQTQIQVRQQKVGSKEREFVRIEIHEMKEPPHDNARSSQGSNQPGNSQDNPTARANDKGNSP